MKKLFLFFAVIFSFFIFSQTTYSAGSSCCTGSFTFDPNAPIEEACQPPPDKPYINPHPIDGCNSGETCFSAGLTSSGICSLPEASGNSCCPNEYSFSGGVCVKPGTGQITQLSCSAEEICVKNVCIVEVLHQKSCETDEQCPDGCTCQSSPNRPDRGKLCKSAQGYLCSQLGTFLYTPTIGPITCNGGIETALGCLPTEVAPLVNKIIAIAVPLGAGFALFFILYGAFTIITSAGNPDSLKNGQQIISSAIIGLVFIIFSVFLLRLIGYDVLEIFKNS